MRVLLVDDERYAVEGLRKLLDWSAFQGESVGIAQNGQEALELVLREKPDVIISDIKMPVMDGLALARAVREQSPQTTMILLSGHGEFAYAQQALQYGVTEYLLKPVTKEKLRQLEALLVRLNTSKSARREGYLTAWDDHLHRQISEILRKGDRDAFDGFFQSERFLAGMTEAACNPTGIQLLHFLYAFLEELHIDTTILEASRKKNMERYLDLSSPHEKKDFLLTSFTDVFMSIERQRHANGDTVAKAAQRLADEEFANADFNISYAAEKLRVSVSYLSTTFKQSTGSNLSEYIIALRMERAKLLLSSRAYTIGDVAAAAGYPDAKYFAKLFKRRVGVTPSEYRNLQVLNH